MEYRVNKTQARIDKLMELIPDLPKNFDDWIYKNSLPKSKYIFYKKIGKKVHGVCSCCGQRVLIQDDEDIKLTKYVKHNGIGRCPKCKKSITFKAINKAKYYRDSEVVSIMQKTKERKKDQYVIRYFKVTKVYKHDEDTSSFPYEILNTLVNPEYIIWEGSREVLTINKNRRTKFEAVEKLWDWKTSQDMWKKERKRSSFFAKELLRDSTPFMYRRNLKRLLKNTKWKYSGLDHYNESYMNMGEYLGAYEEYPVLEMLSKIGANQIISDIIYDYTRGYGAIHGYLDARKKFLGVSKSIFQRAVKLGLPARRIEFLVILDELKYNLTDEQVKWAIINTNTETFTQLLRYTSANKIISYIESKVKEREEKHNDSRYMDSNYMATTWRDYLHQCETLDVDLNKSYFLFPNDLEERHAEYSKVIKAKEDKGINAGIIETFNKWKDLDYEEGEYKIVVARNQKMIIAEGSYMGHCVGGTTYTKGMAQGKKLILMCRKNNKPYSTIELNPVTFKIVQNHGKNYCLPPDAVEFADRWLKKHVSKIKKQRLSQSIEKTIKPVTSPVPGGNINERIAI